MTTNRLLTMLVCSLFLVGCAELDAETTRSSGDPDGDLVDDSAAITPTFRVAERSLLIRDPVVVNSERFKSATDFGYLLAVLNDYVRTLPGQQNRSRPAGTFITRIFDEAINENAEHEALPAAKKLGGDPLHGPFERTMEAVYRNWASRSELELLRDPDDLRGGPFRLLAIVNRLDLAGDIDDRGNSEAAAEPRALGEVHLVYGLIDAEYEEQTGQPFPMTFVQAYRIPARSGASQWDMIRDRALWQTEMQQWARDWSALSGHEKHTQAYQDRLEAILDPVLQPENFIGLRSNTQINEEEFELRSWYVIQTRQNLIKRKPRREPYRCLSGSRELGDLVNHFWNPSYRDLDVTTLANMDPLLDGANGFTVVRTNVQFGRILYPVESGWSSCANSEADRPFLMEQIGGNNTDPDNRLMVAPVARFSLPGEIWQTGTYERRRHAFAIRTCSGCHSQEGAAQGFHVSPALANEPAGLSPYLRGAGQNTFTYAGTTYEYSILRAREQWLDQAADGTAVLFDSLKRPELRDL